MFRPFDILFWLHRFRFWRQGVRHRTFPMNGRRIHYWEGGTGSPLLLVHGLGGSVIQDFSDLIPKLSRHFRIVAADLPGFGFSHKVPFTQSISAQSVFLREFLDHVGIDRADLLGNSMGGWIALHFAHRFPKRVKRMILTAPAGILFEPPPLDVFTPCDESGMRRLIEHLFHRPPKLPTWIIRDWLRTSRARRQGVTDMLQSMLTQVDLMDPHVGGIEHPTLIIWGTEDRLLPVEMGRRLVTMMPNASLHELEECGHLLLHEKSALSMQLIKNWLKPEDLSLRSE